MGDSKTAEEGKFSLPENWHSQPSHLRVVCVGAGPAGLALAYKMKQMKFTNYDLRVYEKNPKVGGTWYENRYPGCACDVAAHVYTYSFEPYAGWSRYYAPSAEIRQYFERFAEKHCLSPNIEFNTRVLSATWVEAKGLYELVIEDEKGRVNDWCHVLVNASGILNSWKWPDIDGLHDFKGQLVHSASWDAGLDWSQKTVAVIGNGSSAIQIIPQIQKSAKHLTSFMRSNTWIAPRTEVTEASRDEKVKPDSNNAQGLKRSPPAQFLFTKDEIEKFTQDPEYHLRYRRTLDGGFNSAFDMFLKDTEASKNAQKAMTIGMQKRIGAEHEELAQKLIPSWPPGCRRLTPGEGYLEALVQSNVTTVHDEISRIVPEGVVDKSGKLHKVDVLVCATGFNITLTPSFDVNGVDGIKMADGFGSEPQVYLSVAVPKFPNYFIINGVRGQWAAGSVLPSHEVSVEYILKCAWKIQTQGIRALEVKQEPVDHLNEYIDTFHERSVFGADCKSWFKKNDKNGKVWLWGGSSLHYLKTLREPMFEHFDIRTRNKNVWAFLGNGRVEAEVRHKEILETEGKDELLRRMAPYLRNADEHWEI